MQARCVVVGANTPTGAVITAHVDNDTEVDVSTNSTFGTTETFGPYTPGDNGRIVVQVEGLEPNQQYYYRLRVAGEDVDEAFRGQFRTTPVTGEPASFTVAAASCAGTGSEYPVVGDVLNPNRISNHPVFSIIESQNPLQFIHMGDIHYYDIGSGVHVPTPTNGVEWTNTYNRAMDDVLTQPNQQQLYSNVATPWIFDDHDFGPNDSDGTSAGRDYITRVYRDYWPHYPMPAGPGSNPIYQSWQIGRVLFVALDVRSDRSPNSANDDDSKGMLGQAQLDWLQGLLAATPAQGLVLISGSQWIRNGADTWARFETERAKLIRILDETGFIDRMVIVSGDTHELAIDTGGNSAANIPVFQFASLDSNHAANPANIYDTGPSRPGRGQYGLLDIHDDGQSIRITGRCMIMTTVWREHSVVWDSPYTPVDPDPIGPGYRNARVTRGITYYAASAVTGEIIDEIPEVSGSLPLIVADHSSTSLTVPIPLSDQYIHHGRIMSALAPGRNVIVAVVNNTPVWSGWILTRQGGTDPTMTVGCVTPEAALMYRLASTHRFTNVDYSTIIATIMATDCGPKYGGQPFRLLVDAPPTGKRTDFEVEAQSYKKVGQVLDELLSDEDGPEWTVRTRWRDDRQQAFDWVLEVRPEVGLITPQPDHVFEVTAPTIFDSSSDSDARYSREISYADANGANVWRAYSTGEGDSKPVSEPVISTAALDSGVPVMESIFQPGTDIEDRELLLRHARSMAELTAFGVESLDIEARFDAYPRVGFDWNLGDTVGWRLIGHESPNGSEGQGRVMGYTIDPINGTVSPLLWSPEVG